MAPSQTAARRTAATTTRVPSASRGQAQAVPRLHPPSPSRSLRRGDGGRMRRPARMRPPALGCLPIKRRRFPVQPPRSKRAGLVTISLPIQPSAEAGGANYTWMHTHMHTRTIEDAAPLRGAFRRRKGVHLALSAPHLNLDRDRSRKISENGKSRRRSAELGGGLILPDLS